ncbi:acyltransferase [Micromonospora globispora]|uniref:Acyltransferase n=1 Tax=Micromonospora globispora TaxID=1450148 RepID=A0A317KEY7_9ACTN|nr:acyltransferase [Micromonospora globispora]PWU52130.1 acyltransferase [Micromonospora globispora]
MTGTLSPPGKLTQSPVSTRLPSLTGLRWTAALAVFVYHNSQNIPGVTLYRDADFNNGFQTVALPAGGLGVSIFYVLSGFVLTWSARPNDTMRAFWRRRFVKIYPNYLITWLMAMGMFALAVTPAWVALLNLAMLQPWVPRISVFFSVDMPSWSVGVEAFFYVMFPVLYLAFRRIDPDRLKYWIAGVIAGIVAIPALLYLALPSTPAVQIYPASETQLFLAYVFPPSRLLDFALGILVARAVTTGRWRDIGTLRAGLLLAASYVVSLFVPYLYGLRAVSIVPIALLIAAAATSDIRGRSTLLRHPLMVWLGNISYAFYLVQFMTYLAVRFSFGTRVFSTPAAIAIQLLGLVVTIAVAAGLYYLVERPLVRRWSNSRRKRRAEDSRAVALH